MGWVGLDRVGRAVLMLNFCMVISKFNYHMKIQNQNALIEFELTHAVMLSCCQLLPITLPFDVKTLPL